MQRVRFCLRRYAADHERKAAVSKAGAAVVVDTYGNAGVLHVFTHRWQIPGITLIWWAFDVSAYSKAIAAS